MATLFKILSSLIIVSLFIIADQTFKAGTLIENDKSTDKLESLSSAASLYNETQGFSDEIKNDTSESEITDAEGTASLVGIYTGGRRIVSSGAIILGFTTDVVGSISPYAPGLNILIGPINSLILIFIGLISLYFLRSGAVNI